MSRRGLLLGAGVAGLFLLHAVWLAGVAEDAFISFRFARHLAEGHGLRWNLGQPPVEGYTHVLWVLLLAGGLRLGLDPVATAPVVGAAAALATLAYLHRSSARLLGWGDAGAWLPALLLALSGPFATWAVAGLETPLFGLLVLAGVHHSAAWWKTGDPRQPWAAAGALLLASLTRFEGLLVAALVLAVAVGAAPGRPRAGRRIAAPLLLAAALFAAYFAWRWSHFGHLLPIPFYAKTGGGLAQAERGARYTLYFLWHFGAPWLPLLALAAWARRRAPVGAAARGAAWLRENALLATSAAVLGGYAVYVSLVGGDYMAMYRFFAPVLPLAALLLAAAARSAARAPRLAGAPGRAALTGALALALLGTLVHSTPLEAALFARPPGVHGNHRGVQTERWHVTRLSLLGRFFAGHASGPEESLGTDAIGAVSWYSGLMVYGAHGLVDPALARRRAGDARLGRGAAGHDRLDFAYLFERRPTFLMFSRELRPRPIERVGLPPGVDAEVAAAYRPVSVWLEDLGNGEAGYFTFLERRDRGR